MRKIGIERFLSVVLLLSFLFCISMAFNSGKDDGYIQGQLDCQNGNIKQYKVVSNSTRYEEIKEDKN